MDFGTLHEVNVFTVGGLGLILNTVLIILIRKKSPPEFKAYASFLTLNAYVDGLHSLAILTTQSASCYANASK